jgi:hypothetical protein
MKRFPLAVVAALTLLHLLTGWGSPVGQPEGERDPILAASVTGTLPTAAPAGFATRMGYSPVLVTGTGGAGPGHIGGGCSSPFGDTSYAFGAACMRHDYGYDLLRYADQLGRPLGPSVRSAIDHRFTQELQHSCASAGCYAAAWFYESAVKFNTWRQGGGPPVEESVLSLVAPVVAALGGGMLLVLPRRRRRVGAPIVGAGLAFALWMQPALPAHPWRVQVPVGALVVLQGYGLGLLARRIVDRFARPAGRGSAARCPASAWLTGGAAVALLGGAFVTAHEATLSMHRSLGMLGSSWWSDLLVVTATLLLVIGLLRLPRAVAAAVWLVRDAGRRRPRTAQPAVAAGFALALVTSSAAPASPPDPARRTSP